MVNSDAEVDIRSDDEIIKLFWEREESAIDKVARKYGGLIYSVAYNILHDSGESEECVNDTYLALWRAIQPSKPEHFSAYLCGIVRNIALDRYKARHRRKRVHSELTVSFEDLLCDIGDIADESAEGEKLSGIIGSYISELNKRQKKIFVARYYIADPVERIASTLGISVSMVYKELSAIKRGLREHLKKEGVYL